MSPFEVPENTGITVTINGNTHSTDKVGAELRDFIFTLARDTGWKKVKVFDSNDDELSIEDIADGNFVGNLIVQQHNVAA